ncbi:tetratricopeptide repeat protein [Leptolyngbya sp. AN02str]|uniref:tetratricopeptide repeat protein n=1 Tax=Leptolyngbya sp. AN02str TaxID=3423363 RepID=UPI003D31F7D9
MALPVQSAFTAYRTALQVLDLSEELSEAQAIAILCARDAVHQALTEQYPISSDRLLWLKALDAKFKEHKQRIYQAIQEELPAYRSMHPDAAAHWWWHLDDEPAVHQRDRGDWLFKLLTLGSWTVILALLLNIANRFLSVGLGVTGTAAVILPSLLAFLKARSDLTEAGQKGIEQLFTKLGIPKHWQEEAKLGSTLVLLGGIVGLWCSLPAIADFYNRRGLDLYYGRHLRQAEQHYRQAIALDSDHAEAHYNLGLVYEDWLRLDEAKEFYQIASSQGLVEAHNNLARLLIQEEKYQEAVILLQDGLFLRNRTEIKPEEEFNLYKNLGWARFSQGYFQDAEAALESAIEIASINNTQQRVRSSAAAHCLLAQVLEQQDRPSDSLQQWQECCQQGIERLERRRAPILEEDQWLHQAQQRLQAHGKSCPSPDTTL